MTLDYLKIDRDNFYPFPFLYLLHKFVSPVQNYWKSFLKINSVARNSVHFRPIPRNFVQFCAIPRIFNCFLPKLGNSELNHRNVLSCRSKDSKLSGIIFLGKYSFQLKPGFQASTIQVYCFLSITL